MNKEFIPYEQALELKELGFNERCFGFYNPIHENQLLRTEVLYDVDGGSFGNWNQTKYFISAPLYQQAFRWFREKYGYIGGIRMLGTSGNNIILGEFYKDDDNYFMMFGETYEDCELKSLKKLIEVAKNK